MYVESYTIFAFEQFNREEVSKCLQSTVVVILARNVTRPCFLTKIKRTPREDTGIRDVERSRGLGDVYKRQTSRYAPGLTCQLAFASWTLE